MVKRRQLQEKKQKINNEAIEKFASNADLIKEEDTEFLDKNAKRDFKAIRVPFNEYEYNKLEEVAKKTGRTKLNALRWAIIKLSEDNQ